MSTRQTLAQSVCLLTRSQVVHVPRHVTGMKQKSGNLHTEFIESDPQSLVAAKPYDQIPRSKGLRSIPYIGSVFHFKPFGKYKTSQMHLLLADQQNQHGPIFRIQFDQPTVVVTDPQDIATVFKHEGKYPKRPAINIADIFFKRSGKKPDFGNLQGEEWQKTRAPINKHVLRPNSVYKFLMVQNSVADEFARQITGATYKTYKENDGPFFWYAAESVALILFNRRIGFLDQNVQGDSQAYIQATADLFDLMKKSLFGEVLMYRFYKDKTYQEFARLKKFMEKEILKFIVEAKEETERRKREGTFDPDEPNISMALLSEENLTDVDVANTLESLYLAATESTAGTLQTIFFLLATNADKQEKLREEVHRVIGRDGPLTKQALNEMSFLRACLKECYRCVSPSPLATVRELPVDVVLGGYRIPAGTQVMGFNRKLQQQGFEDPDQFLPERWLRGQDGKMVSTDHSKWGVLPFGYGARSCIGKRLAEQEIYLAMAKTIQRAKIGIEAESLDTQFEYGLFVKPSKPIQFTFSPV